MHQKQRRIPQPALFCFLLVASFALGLPIFLLGGCNDYPFLSLTSKPYAEITDIQQTSGSQKVDILFIIDNSGSMGEEQQKLKTNFEGFITELLNKEINDFQIGIITSDMDNPQHSGKLRAAANQPKIIQGSQLSKAQVVTAFTQNALVGIDGTSFEKHLDAMRAALTAPLVDDSKANKGFLRSGSLLAIIFVADEDDCSHNGKIPETEYDSEVCRLPSGQILKDASGQPVLDSSNQPIRGQMQHLHPTKTYIDMLNTLKAKGHDVVVSGLIGDPIVYKDKNAQSKVPIDPAGGCRSDAECTLGAEIHRCIYLTEQQKKCGGCKSPDADAVPGFRIYDLIKAFGGADQWFPICGDNEGFKGALLRFAGLIIDKIKSIALSNPPSSNQSIIVQIIQPDGTTITVPPAAATGKSCAKDQDCGGENVCGRDSKCYGDGWVYYAPIAGDSQAKIKLSGNSKTSLTPGSKVKISYSTK